MKFGLSRANVSAAQLISGCHLQCDVV